MPWATDIKQTVMVHNEYTYIYIYKLMCIHIYIYIYINTYIYGSQRNAGGALRPDSRAHCDVHKPDGRAHRVLQCTAPVTVYPSENKHIIWSRRNHNYVFVLRCLYFTPDIYFRCCLSNFLFHRSIEMSVKKKSIQKWELKHQTYAGKQNVPKWRPKIYQAKCHY